MLGDFTAYSLMPLSSSLSVHTKLHMSTSRLCVCEAAGIIIKHDLTDDSVMLCPSVYVTCVHSTCSTNLKASCHY